MIERMRLWIQAAEMSFLCRVAVYTLLDRVRSSVIREELKVDLLLLCTEKNLLRWFRHLIWMRPQGRPRTRLRDYISKLAW